MGLEDRGAQQDKVVVDKYADPTTTYQMTTYDYVVRPSCTSSFTITLPPVAEAKGRFYSIIARLASVAAAITVADKSDSECWGGNLTLNFKCDKALLYSDGLAWHVLSVLTYSS